jgi:hypothetical protein
MATELKNISLITVLTISMKDNNLEVIHDAQMQKTTGNPQLAGIPVNDTTMAAAVTTFQTYNNGYNASPPLYTKAQVNSKKLVVVTAYNQNAGYIQGVARSIAQSAGDVNVGIQLVEGAGYYIKNSHKAATRHFKATNAGPGAVDISTKAVAPRAGYLRQYAPTTALDVTPNSANIVETLFSLQEAIHVNNLKRNTVYAFREAYILPVKRKPTGGSGSSTAPATTELLKTATPIAATKEHKVVFTDGVVSHYTWGPWIYIIIT